MTVLTGDQFARADEAGRLLEVGPRGTPEPDDREPTRLFVVESVNYDGADAVAAVSPVGLATGDFVLKVDAAGELVTDEPEHFYAVVDAADATVRLRAATAVYAAEDEPPAAAEPPADDGATPPPD